MFVATVSTVPSSKPTFMAPAEAARALQGALKAPKEPLTVADAAAKSGLALRDAELGLTWLTQEYRGHLRVTEDGDLVYLFPTGFEKPWVTRDAVERAFAATGKVVAGVARFVVRAWLTIAIFAYAAIFVGVLIALTLARQSSSDRDDGFPGASLLYVLFRVLADALFWTFHPFSPMAIGTYGAYDVERPGAWRKNHGQEREKTPFYEKVNRFVFGPTPPPEDPRAMEQRVLAEIRAQKGRIGLFDVMRITGLPREVADPMMARLMLDYEGDVDVSEGGGITYRFQALRKTAAHDHPAPPPPAWVAPKSLGPLTGNSVGSNVMIALLNGFNLLMSVFAIDANLTIGRISNIVAMIRMPDETVPLPYDGVPVLLGVIPLVFSLALFVLPLGRALLRPQKAKAIAKENGRLGLLREILTRVRRRAPLTETALKEAWKRAAGDEPSDEELTRAIVDLGGDVDLRDTDEGASNAPRLRVAATEESVVRYRFIDLETETEALEEERATAKDEEAKLGKIAFATDR